MANSSSSRKTYFAKEWLQDPEFKGWISGTVGATTFGCCLQVDQTIQAVQHGEDYPHKTYGQCRAQKKCCGTSGDHSTYYSSIVH